MRKRQLLDRIEQLEQRLAIAEAKLATLQTYPVPIPYIQPMPYEPYRIFNDTGSPPPYTIINTNAES